MGERVAFADDPLLILVRHVVGETWRVEVLRLELEGRVKDRYFALLYSATPEAYSMFFRYIHRA